MYKWFRTIVLLALLALPHALSAQALADSTAIEPDLQTILFQLNAARDQHNPDNLPAWQSDLYSRIEMDLSQADRQFLAKAVTGMFRFVNEYKDTTRVPGETILPVMISETASTRYHSLEPPLDKEEIVGNRISGIEDENIFKKFTGSMLLKGNFYRNNLNIFNIEIPSPLSATSHPFYQYELKGTTVVDGRRLYRIGFGPRPLVTSPIFSGTMEVDAEDFGIRSITASLDSVSNVNWIRNLKLEIDNRRLNDRMAWFPEKEILSADFSIALTKKSHRSIASLFGERQIVYQMPVFDQDLPERILNLKDNVLESPDAGSRDDSFWQALQTPEQTVRGARTYEMVDRVQNTGLYKTIFVLADMMSTGYLENHKIGVGLGPYDRLVSFNKAEGTRIQVGFRTMKEFSQKIRFSGYLAYGTLDRKWKGKGCIEYMFRRDLTRKLTLTYKYDFWQLGKGTGSIPESNVFNSILAPSSFNKRGFGRDMKAEYEHEFNPDFTGTLTLQSIRIFDHTNVPLVDRDGMTVPSVSANQIQLLTRFSREETVSRNYFKKSYLYSRFPVFTLTAGLGVKGITPDDCGFLRTEARMDWNIPLGKVGSGTVALNAGAIFGEVPYPFLKLHEGNKTYFLDKTAFSCMDYYEFASDRWITAFYEHNFGGFFLGKIPGVKKLKLREVVSLRAAWGTISPTNRYGTIQLPAGMKTLETPYVEAGVGIANIFRLLRVDCFWRLTNRGERNFAFNVGLGIEF